MPRHRPIQSGYARLSQAEEEQGYYDDSEEDDPSRAPRTLSSSQAQYAPIQPQPHRQMAADSNAPNYDHSRRRIRHGRRPRRSSSGVDIKAINARLERWAEEIASKFKINKVRGKSEEEEQLEIQYSVFQAPEGMRPLSVETLSSTTSEQQAGRMTKIEFDDVVESVKVAIELGVHPKMISQGSSGSYFAKNSDGKTVGVFKPKDEEPYASRNPKWTKWIHRNLFPCFFGRACLIPNLSYISEAAAYVLDTRLRTNLVPYTDIVYLSSKSFFYDFWDRSAYYRKRKPFPAKVGSFQVFLKGFKDANLFLRDHPWPDHTNSGFRPQDAPKRRKRPWTETCRPQTLVSDDEEEESSNAPRSPEAEGASQSGGGFMWTETIQQSFREELEKLVILDYIMRNTDRGLDNWMIRVDTSSEEVTIVSDPPKLNGHTEEHAEPTMAVPSRKPSSTSKERSPYRRQESMVAASRSSSSPPMSEPTEEVSISIGAIDNSLSWPWKHPDAWRSFPFGWLFLPVSLIGQPFSQRTRDHFLPLLTSKQWWSETQMALRRIFSQDSDFKERMFARQIAVMKGQAWNVVETLKQKDHGPLELTRRARVCVWDDLVEVPVAIPMRAPSVEARRRRDAGQVNGFDDEEMDISAANAAPAAKYQSDLMDLGLATTELPNPNRFDLSNASDHGFGPESPATVQGVAMDHSTSLRDSSDFPERPNAGRSRIRSSLDAPSRAYGALNGSHRRRYSYSARHGGGYFASDGDDLEGDLGYAAAEGMESNRRKVIVERLESVKSKNPVFTCC